MVRSFETLHFVQGDDCRLRFDVGSENASVSKCQQCHRQYLRLVFTYNSRIFNRSKAKKKPSRGKGGWGAADSDDDDDDDDGMFGGDDDEADFKDDPSLVRPKTCAMPPRSLLR